MLEKILEYQKLETELIGLESELANSKERKKANEISANLKNQHARILTLETMSEKANNSYKLANKKFNEYLSKLKEFESKVETLRDDELEACEKLIKEYMGLANSLEKDIQQIYTNMIEINREYEDIMRKSKKDRSQYDMYRLSYNKQKAEVEPKIAEIKSKLSSLEKQVDEKLLGTYKKKREGKIFPVYVKLIKNLCGGCRMEIPASKLSQMKSNNLSMIECENCGRVIYQSEV